MHANGDTWKTRPIVMRKRTGSKGSDDGNNGSNNGSDDGASDEEGVNDNQGGNDNGAGDYGDYDRASSYYIDMDGAGGYDRASGYRGRREGWSGGGVVVVVSDELALHAAVCFVIHSRKHYVRCKYCIPDIGSVA
jgi:hypothetical protein